MRRQVLLLAVLLSGSFFPGWSRPDQSRLGKVAEAMLEMRQIGVIVEGYRRDHGTYPESGPTLQPIRDVLRNHSIEYRKRAPSKDPWGEPYFYRGDARSYQVISFGSDRSADREYGIGPVGIGVHAPITDSVTEEGDLVLADGRFVQRPFNDREPAYQTINAINSIFVGAAAFAVDHNRYPGDAIGFVPVAELADELVPLYLSELPLEDGWGRAILYSGDGGALFLASFGSDGTPDRVYYPDLPCGLSWAGSSPSPVESADIVQACGRFIAWPTGTEP